MKTEHADSLLMFDPTPSVSPRGQKDEGDRIPALTSSGRQPHSHRELQAVRREQLQGERINVWALRMN